MKRFLSFVAAAALLVAGGAVTASPAAAAAPAVTIMQAGTFACLYQSFDGNGAATVNAYFAASPCDVSGGNAQWRFEYVGGDNIYRIVNNRWDPRGLWCPSAPNDPRDDDRVYVELCAPGVPGKQRWRPISNTVNDRNRLMNIGTGQCLYRYERLELRHQPITLGCKAPSQTWPYQDFQWI